MSKAINLLLALAGALSSVALAGSALAQEAAAPAPSADRGHQKAAMCIGCHGIVGYQASFPEVYKVPMISGQNAKYIGAALNAYKKGERKHPTMHAVAMSLSDTDIADLAAFYEKNAAPGAAPAPAPEAPKAASTEVAALLTRGACASCHGANFSKPIDPSYPKIGGQHADYLYASLRAYGIEGKATVGRGNAIMAAQVKQFKREELKAIAQYLSTLPGEVHVVPQPKFR